MIKLSLILAFLFNLNLCFAQDLGDHVAEVFVKGSDDGESVFLVLGMKSGFKLAKGLMKNSYHLRDLADLPKRFYNEEHKNDFTSELSIGASATKEAFLEIFKAPWRSMKKMPKAHKVTIEQAHDAYKDAKTYVGGGAKFAGIASWALVKDSYYLVIETPYMFMKNVLTTTLALPFRFTFQVLEIGLRFTWAVTKPVLAPIISGALLTYSFVSSTIGSAVTFIVKGPSFLWRPKQTILRIEGGIKDQDKLKTSLQAVIEDTLSLDGSCDTEIEEGENKLKFRFHRLEKVDKKLELVVKVKLRKDHIKVKLLGTHHFESKELWQKLTQALNKTILENLSGSLSKP